MARYSHESARNSRSSTQVHSNPSSSSRAVPDGSAPKAHPQASSGRFGRGCLRAFGQPVQCELDIAVTRPGYQFIHRRTSLSHPCCMARSNSCLLTSGCAHHSSQWKTAAVGFGFLVFVVRFMLVTLG